MSVLVYATNDWLTIVENVDTCPNLLEYVNRIVREYQVTDVHVIIKHDGYVVDLTVFSESLEELQLRPTPSPTDSYTEDALL